MIRNKIVFPGDQLSTTEEFSAGEGTFEEEGIIRSAIVGVFEPDEKHRIAVVKPIVNTPVEIKKGDTVLAEVESVKQNMIIANVIHVMGKNRSISGDTNATIHVSEISSGYVKDSTTEYGLGDIVRARVIQTKPSLQLSTKDKNLGVIKARCSKCRYPLIKKGNVLRCVNCRNIEKRKIAADYGEYDINKL